MARDKPSPLTTIRKQVARDQRIRASAFAGSAYADLSTGAHAARAGIRTSTYPDQGGISAAPITIRAPGAGGRNKVEKKVVRRKVLPKNRLRGRDAERKDEEGGKEVVEKEKEVECWEPAGGHAVTFPHRDDEDVSVVLGIARVAKHRLTQLMPALEGLMRGAFQPEHMKTKDVPFKEEKLVDIFAMYASRAVAEAAREKLDGEVVAGRKLQVRFARDRVAEDGKLLHGMVPWWALLPGEEDEY